MTGQAENVDRWNFSGNPHDFSAFGKGSIPFFAGTSNPACVAKAASQQTLATYGCYVVGNSVMTPPALGTYGNLRRNFFFGNTFSAWDGSVIKDTKIGERFSAEFRFEIFNVLNHTNFGNPSFNGGGGTDPFTPGSGFGNSNNTPDVANNNPALGSGGPREFLPKRLMESGVGSYTSSSSAAGRRVNSGTACAPIFNPRALRLKSIFPPYIVSRITGTIFETALTFCRKRIALPRVV